MLAYRLDFFGSRVILELEHDHMADWHREKIIYVADGLVK